MNCERCNKRLSRKTARLIDGKTLCSSCMFAPLDALRERQDALAAGAQSAETNEDLAQSEGRQSGPKGNAQGPKP